MFFIFGISNGHKELHYQQSFVCYACSRYGEYHIFMEYTFISLFFIPVFKWNKTYYVKANCCKALYTIDRELGNQIAKGGDITLRQEDLHAVNSNEGFGVARCSQCGFTTNEDYQYCPKCANPLK